jgi:carbon monoxide dehydrogenase subunit G
MPACGGADGRAPWQNRRTMTLDGQFTLEAPQAEVYAFLSDPRQVGQHLPDVRNVVIEDADHFTVTARVGVAHIKGDVVMKMAIAERRPPVSTTIAGKGTGLASVLDMITSFTLEPAGEARTVVHWQGQVTISGKLAAFGPQGLLDRIARKNIDTFIDGLRRGFAARSDA